MRLRRRLLPWALRARAVDPRRRRDPDFVVVGAQKAGSTSLFAYLAAHPEVDQPLVKEIQYFTNAAARGQDWYRRHFPVDDDSGRITGEASPYYMVHPLALDRLALALPEVKILVILREPVSRLVSHFRHNLRLGVEHLTLTEALRAEDARLAPDFESLAHDPFQVTKNLQRYSYLRRSLYSGQVEKIRTLWPDRSMFLRLEDLVDTQALQPLCDFLGIEFRAEVPFEPHNVNEKAHRPPVEIIDPETIEQLRHDADRTCDLLGWEHWRF
jgi:hypothetical protein